MAKSTVTLRLDSDLFMQQRKAAEASEEPEMSLEEINQEIRAAREELRKKKEMA